MMKEMAKRSANMIVKGSTAEAWETTAKLRSQYLYTTLDAMPARVADASKEWASLRAKIVSRDVTVNDIGVGAVRAAEIYAFYIVGRVIGSRSFST